MTTVDTMITEKKDLTLKNKKFIPPYLFNT